MVTNRALPVWNCGPHLSNMSLMISITKGNNSVKNVGGVMVLVLCTLYGDALYSTKFHKKYLKEFLSYLADSKS